MSDYEELLRQLRSALAHLDAPLRLENHPLTRRIGFVAEAPEVSRGAVLRRTLRLAIESLDPGAGVPASAHEARAYQVLYRYAIAKQSMVAIAAELDIGERQAYRELRHALAALASILFPDGPVPEPESALLSANARRRAAQVREEVERLSDEQRQEISLSELATGIIESARPLASERHVGIRLQDEAPALRVAANRTMLRQALLNLLSHVVRTEQGGEVVVRLYRSGTDAHVELTYGRSLPAAPPHPTAPYAVASQLFAALGLSWDHRQSDDGSSQVEVRIPLAQEHSILIVDDNQGFVTLFRRFLRGQPYRVYEAASATEALELVAGLQPEVIILDVMMRGRDGWEVLQALRASDPGRQARIVVCSIIDDPQLSAALGADAFLHKPVDRARLLHTLADVLSLSGDGRPPRSQSPRRVEYDAFGGLPEP